MLDIACGNGAVMRFALAARQSSGPNSDLHISGIDESPAALEEMRKRHPTLCGIAANAALLPFHDGAFDLVTSQFGMEYAGPNVFAEAARVVGHGGLIAAVLHLRGGGIYRECAINLDAIDGFRNCDLLDCFKGLFRVALAVQQGHNGKDLFRRADEKFAGSVAAAEEVLQRWGRVWRTVPCTAYIPMLHTCIVVSRSMNRVKCSPGLTSWAKSSTRIRAAWQRCCKPRLTQRSWIG